MTAEQLPSLYHFITSGENMGNMTHRKRLETCLAGDKPDRTPVALWRHFPVDDQTPGGLAAAALNFQQTFDFDLVKYTPASSFCLKDWGSRDEWRGAPEGTRDYTYEVIKNPDDWVKLDVLDPEKGHLGEQLESLQMLVAALGPDPPVIQTIFNPLSQAKNLVGKEKLQVHLRKYPQALLGGLKIITETTRKFVEAAMDTGIAGVFFAVQHGQYSLLSEDEYARFGRVFDLQVLQPAKDLWLNMLHIHGEDVMFDYFLDYPVQIVNWHDRETSPSLGEARRRYDGVLCGGLQRQATMVLGTRQDVIDEAQDAISQTDGLRFILGTGCVTPTIAPFGNIMAARNAVESFKI
jgi:uroporphyrinogen decarboxylase